MMAADSQSTGSESAAGMHTVVGRIPLWFDVALATVFGVFYAFDVWEVVGSIVTLTSFGFTFNALGWTVLVVSLVAPVVCFVTAFLLGRRHGALMKAVLYFGGLAVSATLFLNLTVVFGALPVQA